MSDNYGGRYSILIVAPTVVIKRNVNRNSYKCEAGFSKIFIGSDILKNKLNAICLSQRFKKHYATAFF